MANSPHCSLTYHKLISADFLTFGFGVGEGIYDNTSTFATPPIAETDYKALLNVYSDKLEAYKNGGKAQKGAYLTARTNLMNALDTTGNYVDALTGVDEEMITLAGFIPTKTGETKSVVCAAPVVDKIEHGAKGVLEPSCRAVTGAEYYGVIVLDKPMDAPMEYNAGALSAFNYSGFIGLNTTKGRKKTITNLTSKTEYWFYFFAGNSAGVSQLSAAVSMVCG